MCFVAANVRNTRSGFLIKKGMTGKGLKRFRSLFRSLDILHAVRVERDRSGGRKSSEIRRVC